LYNSPEKDQSPLNEQDKKIQGGLAAGSQLSTIQEVNHTINLQRVRIIVRKEANRTRPKAINQLQLLQTVDLTIVTDSSNSSNSWLNKINRYNSNRSQTITIAIVRVISEQ
jgi:hypothetical protein